MDLGDGAVDAPASAHFSPVKNEFAGGVGEDHVLIVSDISVVTEITDGSDGHVGNGSIEVRGIPGLKNEILRLR